MVQTCSFRKIQYLFWTETWFFFAFNINNLQSFNVFIKNSIFCIFPRFLINFQSVKEILGFHLLLLAPCFFCHFVVKWCNPNTWREMLFEALLGLWGRSWLFLHRGIKMPDIKFFVSWWRYLYIEKACFSPFQRIFVSANYGNPRELAVFL